MASNSEVAKLREARDSPSVLKARLALVRSRLPDVRIIVFEGPDDKIVYSQWIRKIDETFNYEPVVCGGKRAVRSLKNICARDRTELSDGVLFIVDHDFDGLDGFENVDSVYCTPTYSFENYLVCKEVLDLILRDEFPCDGSPELRAIICRIFHDDYTDFLRVTRPLNYRIFLARHLKINISSNLDPSLTTFARIEIQNVRPGSKLPHEIVEFTRRPTGAEIKKAVKKFRQLNGPQSYRGKFAFKFFKVWLERLIDEYRKNNIGIFIEIERNHNVRVAEWTLSNFASKCPTPHCFREFILAQQEHPLR